MDDHIARAEQLLEKGRAVSDSHRPNPPNVIGFPTLDSAAFAEWRAQSLSFLTGLLGPEHTYVEAFTKQVGDGHTSCAKRGIGILTAVREDLTAGTIGKAKATLDPLLTVAKLCSRFHQVARQLRSRREDRATLDVRDEHDV